jgi:hypothetical protein
MKKINAVAVAFILAGNLEISLFLKYSTRKNQHPY